MLHIIKKLLGKSIFIQRARFWITYKFTILPKVRRQLLYLQSNGQVLGHNKDKRVLVPIIETSHYQYLQILIVAKALQIRGADVKVLICGQYLDGCEIKSIRNESDRDPCWKCRFNERNLLPLFKLKVISLKDVFNEKVDQIDVLHSINKITVENSSVLQQEMDFSKCVEESVIRYYYGAVPLDVEIVKKVASKHAKTANIMMSVARKLDEQWRPSIVLGNMISYSTWEPFFRYFNGNGDRYRQISLTQFDLKAVQVDSFNLYSNTKRFCQYVESRNFSALTPLENDQLNSFIGDRLSGTSGIFKLLSFFSDNNEQIDLKTKLKINLAKRNIFLFSNIYWDIGLSDCAALFPDVITLVLETIEICMTDDNCHLYIKPHPGEVFDTSSSLKGMSQIIRDKYPVLPKNLTIIRPEWKIRTYDLFQFIDVGVIFNGTVGLEMMLSGIPVISTGKTTHMGLGLAVEPKNKEQYRDSLFGISEFPEIDQEQLKLFAYFYFIRTLIPWTLTKQAYADDFNGFTFDSLDDLKPGKNPYLDHLCNCILDSATTIPEAWPAKII